MSTSQQKVSKDRLVEGESISSRCERCNHWPVRSKVDHKHGPTQRTILISTCFAKTSTSNQEAHECLTGCCEVVDRRAVVEGGVRGSEVYEFLGAMENANRNDQYVLRSTEMQVDVRGHEGRSQRKDKDEHESPHQVTRKDRREGKRFVEE